MALATFPGLFRYLNLIGNPFRALDAEELAKLAVVDAAPWLKHLEEESGLLQFLGEKGRGKTACLLHLASRLGNVDYIHLAEQEPPRCKIRGHIVIDEAQRLPWLSRRIKLRDRRVRAVSSHVDLSSIARRQGRQVLSITVPCNLNAHTLAGILNVRIQQFRITQDPIPRIDTELAHAFLSQFGDDLRHLVGYLYDIFQTLSHEDGSLARRAADDSGHCHIQAKLRALVSRSVADMK